MALKIFKIHHSGSHDLFNQMVKIPDLVINFSVTKPSHVFIMGSVGYAHRKIPLDVSTKSKSEIRDLKNRYGQNLTEYAIGIVGRLEHIDENNSRIWIKGSKWGINISSGSDHYGVIPISGYLEVNPGNHEISYWAEAHTDAPGAYSHPAEIQGTDDTNLPGGTSDPYNQLIIRIEEK